MKHKNSSTLIFDFDGTLIDSQEAIKKSYYKAIIKVAPKHKNFVEQIQIGPSFEDIVSSLPINNNLKCEFKKEYKKEYNKCILKDTYYYENATKILIALKEDFHLSIVTNKRSETTDILIKHFEWSNIFDYIYCSDSGRKNISKKESLGQLIKNDNKYENSIYIGDTRNDYEAAIFNGLRFIRASYGYDDYDSWNLDSTFTEIHSISELPSTLKTII